MTISSRGRGSESSERPRVAIIGGSGLYHPDLLEDLRERSVVTPYGTAEVVLGRFGREPVAFLRRHGAGHSVPPHRVNYRGNVWALAALGVERVIATAAVGALRADPDLAPGSLVLCDQFLDFTHGRVQTFHEGGPTGVVHVDVTEPYCPELRDLLREAGVRAGAPVRENGTYVCTEGPRFETAAEIRMYARLGGDVVGMTGVPEVVLAREAGLCYATVALVANLAAGISPDRLTHREVVAVMDRHAAHLRAVLADVLSRLPRGRERCACGERPEVYGVP